MVFLFAGVAFGRHLLNPALQARECICGCFEPPESWLVTKFPGRIYITSTIGVVVPASLLEDFARGQDNRGTARQARHCTISKLPLFDMRLIRRKVMYGRSELHHFPDGGADPALFGEGIGFQAAKWNVMPIVIDNPVILSRRRKPDGDFTKEGALSHIALSCWINRLLICRRVFSRFYIS